MNNSITKPSKTSIQQEPATTVKPVSRLLFAVSAVLLSSVCQASPAADQLMPVYVLGVQGDAKANEQAIAALTKATAAAPDDLALQAMLGAVQTSAAKHAWMPWNKMKAAEQGLAKLDKSLRLLPSTDAKQPDPALFALSMQVQTIAGCTFIHLPDMFNRFEQGYQLLKGNIQSPAFTYAPVGAQQALYSCGAKAAKKAGDEALANTWQQQLQSETN